MPILVTAFGPFGGRKQNASSLVLQALREVLPEIRTRILPVDAVIAPARLRQAIRKIRPSALIMLGEAAGSTTIRLETTAWNMKDFNIPDTAGRKLSGIAIRDGALESMTSTLPFREIHEYLTNSGHPVSCSDDTGRYLCNQLFFSALDFLKAKSMNVPAGFIHLPLEQDLPISEASVMIVKTIRLLQSL